MGGSSGLQIELELADLTAACVNHTSKSATWQLEHFNVNCDSVTLTSEFTENVELLDSSGDILDPIGQDQSVYDALAQQMEELISIKLKKLTSEGT